MKSILRRSLLLALFTCAPWLSAAAQDPNAMSVTFDIDVRNGDQRGKLMVRQSELAFESLTDGKHSRTWQYAEIRSLEKKRKEIRVKPYKGSRYDFQLPDDKVRDRLYDIISKKIIDARSQGRK
jgi:hypothetical protein